MKLRTKKATMTNKERVEALLRREKPDRVPFAGGGGGFAMLYSGFSLTDQYTKPAKVVYEAERKTCQEFDWVFTPSLGVRDGNQRGVFGSAVSLPSNRYSMAPFVVKYVVETVDDIKALKIPDIKTLYSPEMVDFYKLSCQDEDDNKPWNVTFTCLRVANLAGDIAGMERVCKWMIKNPEAVHRLLRLTADYNIATAQYVRGIFGVERVLPSGPTAVVSNQLVSPKHFEQFALPIQQEVHQKVLAMGFKHLSIHICGEQNLNLPYWQQIPIGDPGFVSVGNEIDLETLAQYFPNDIIEGNLDTTIIQCGTPEEVYQAAGKVIEQGKNLSNGFILKPACQLPPRAPVENMRAITRALNDFGWY
ncbi:MAG: hypothetical protein HY528_00200, partial [Chloroflexi bacterium]|nr:hypothetical protein [Chloroflexota bacterium]